MECGLWGIYGFVVLQWDVEGGLWGVEGGWCRFVVLKVCGMRGMRHGMVVCFGVACGGGRGCCWVGWGHWGIVWGVDEMGNVDCGVWVCDIVMWKVDCGVWSDVRKSNLHRRIEWL